GWVFESDLPSFGEDGIEIITDHERLTLDFSQDGYEERREGRVVRPHLFTDPLLRMELEYWLGCIGRRVQPTIVTPEDGVEAVALAEKLMANGAEQKNSKSQPRT